MGPIQTSMNKLVSIIAGMAAGGKKLYENEEQAATAEKQAAAAQEQAATAEKAKTGEEKGKANPLTDAYRLAQKKGIARPQSIIFDDNSGEAVATYEEMATLLSNHSLSNALDSKKITRDSMKARMVYLSQRGGNE